MKKPVIVRAEAEADLAEAYNWYEQQVCDLGGEFLLCVDAVMASIERNPHLYPVVYKSIIRRALMRRFPTEFSLSSESETFPSLQWPTRSGTREFGKTESEKKRAHSLRPYGRRVESRIKTHRTHSNHRGDGVRTHPTWRKT